MRSNQMCRENSKEAVSLDCHSTSKQREVAPRWMDQEEIMVTEGRQRTTEGKLLLS